MSLRGPVPPGVVVTRIRYRSDGLPVDGYLIAPSGGMGKLPLLVFNRGGIGSRGRLDRGDLAWLARLATQGPYVVVASQYRRADEAGGADVRDVLALVEGAKRHLRVDPARTVMLGNSRGGTMAWLAARHGLPLVAFATVGAPVDGARSYREIGSFMRRRLRCAIGGTPANQPEAYRARSPLAWCDEVEVPVLILHGERDGTISVTQSRDLAAKLKALGRVHELVTIPGGNHQLSNHAAERDRLVLDFFARQLANSQGRSGFSSTRTWAVTGPEQ